MDSTKISKSYSDMFPNINLTQEQKDELALVAEEDLFERIIDRAMENLTSEQRDEFTHVLDQDVDVETIFGYLEDNIPNFFDLVGQEIVEMDKDLGTIEAAINS